jgi:hypothetical protein
MAKKKKSDRLCKFCQVYYDIPTNKRHYYNNMATQSRVCPKIKKEVEPDNEACIYFTLAKYFFCTKDNAFLETVVCLARQKNRREGCVRCKQGSIIRKIKGK